jgi:hypothetical protein
MDTKSNNLECWKQYFLCGPLVGLCQVSSSKHILSLPYMHLTKPNLFTRAKPSLSSERTLQKDHNRDNSIEEYL